MYSCAHLKAIARRRFPVHFAPMQGTKNHYLKLS